MRYLYRYAGVRRLEYARRHVDDALAGWSADWRVDHANEPVQARWQVADAATVDCLAGDDPAGLERMDDTLYLRTAAAAWRRAVFGSAASGLPDDPLACALLAQARAALVSALARKPAGSAPADANTNANAPTSAAQRPVAGRAWLYAGLFHAGRDEPFLQLLLDARRFDAALATPPPVALTPRALAVRNATLPLTLQLPLDSVSAADLQHLRPGVIVQSRHRLDEPLLLGCDTQPRLLRAFLGQRKGRLAVRLDSVAAARTTATESASAASPSSTPETARR